MAFECLRGFGYEGIEYVEILRIHVIGIENNFELRISDLKIACSRDLGITPVDPAVDTVFSVVVDRLGDVAAEVEVHPFQDGNGRLTRILTTLLLLRAGYAYVPYGSLENVIEQSKEGYYLALRQTQGTIRTGAPDWQSWVMYFLKALQQQKNRLEKKIERERVRDAGRLLNYRTATILQRQDRHSFPPQRCTPQQTNVTFS
ncbi:MAG: hypothetical protein HN377_02465 [Alphaproteobacteria bacterium]|nr:hypothetical protein [Alphaproteobacteria bacterium]MBT7941961.1 hypothetical protein [Alphaproteobacteria bacterium]